MTRRLLAALAVVVAAGIVAALPPRALVVTPGTSGPTILRGAIHIHTTNSDGSGTPDDVAAAASRAGLAFIILTDHGDGTRQADSPRYRSGVLVIDAVEISSSSGHVVALGLPRAPYPLRGEPADVLEDVARLGAMSIIAHPTSLKEDARWHDFSQRFDGIEWLNGDSEWRDEHPLSLLRVLATYFFRPPESLALILDRPTRALEEWDRAARVHSVVGIGGTDAHAMIGGDLDHGGPAALHLPSYEQVFRTFSIGLPGVTLTRNAPADAAAVVAAIRAGHVFTAIDAFARPGRLSFTGRSGGASAEAGDRLPSGSPVMLRAEVDAPSTPPTLTLYCNGAAVASAVGPALEYEADGSPAEYRIEATLPETRGTPAPWIVSNPIYVGPAEPPVTRSLSPATATRVVYRDGPASWTVEHSDRAAGAIATVAAVGGTQLSLRYALGGARTDAPFIAFATPVTDVEGFTRVEFSGHSRRPMRVSLQLRVAAGQGSPRWRRSVYLDETPRTIAVPFDEFVPAERGVAPMPALASVSSLLFVVDTLNTALGTNGEFWIDDVVLVR